MARGPACYYYVTTQCITLITAERGSWAEQDYCFAQSQSHFSELELTSAHVARTGPLIFRPHGCRQVRTVARTIMFPKLFPLKKENQQTQVRLALFCVLLQRLLAVLLSLSFGFFQLLYYWQKEKWEFCSANLQKIMGTTSRVAYLLLFAPYLHALFFFIE